MKCQFFVKPLNNLLRRRKRDNQTITEGLSSQSSQVNSIVTKNDVRLLAYSTAVVTNNQRYTNNIPTTYQLYTNNNDTLVVSPSNEAEIYQLTQPSVENCDNMSVVVVNDEVEGHAVGGTSIRCERGAVGLTSAHCGVSLSLR